MYLLMNVKPGYCLDTHMLHAGREKTKLLSGHIGPETPQNTLIRRKVPVPGRSTWRAAPAHRLGVTDRTGCASAPFQPVSWRRGAGVLRASNCYLAPSGAGSSVLHG